MEVRSKTVCAVFLAMDDRGEKMETYCKVGVSEYWIVDWRKKSVEIYMFDYKADGTPYSYLFKVVTEKNKDELGLVMFPNFKISFDRLFDFAWQEGKLSDGF